MIEGASSQAMGDYPKYGGLAFGSNTQLLFLKTRLLETIRCH